MKIITIFIFFYLLSGQSPQADDHLSREDQIQIIENFKYLTGQTKSRPHSVALETYSGEKMDDPPIKCGTPTFIRFQSNFDKFDADLISALDVNATDRPNLNLAYDTPGGHFRLHYDTSGANAIWEADIDLDNNGVPDFIDSVALIAESVYDHIVDSLGFAPPVPDTACFEGEDELYDIYLSALTSNVFGWTKGDTECAVPGSFLMQVPTFIELDNDYQHVTAYKDRPLDAVRVTLAHEFFHAIQFSLDYTEILNLYWLEMSAVWMEEEIYDDINDYYTYLPYFYRQPRTSIQQFLQDLGDFHPYASAVFPIYLSETYGSEIMKTIWQNCADLGYSGGNFLQAAELAIDSMSNGNDSYASAFGQFSLWNFFTGARAQFAPNGIGYSEAANYPTIPQYEVFFDDTLIIYPEFDGYPVPLIRVDSNYYKPEHNAMTLIRFGSLTAVQEDRFWACGDSVPWYNPDCDDSVESVEVLIADTADGYDRHDSLFSVSGGFESLALPGGSATYPWTVSVIYQIAAQLDSFEVETYMLPSNLCNGYNCLQNLFQLDMIRVNQFESATLIFSAASPIEDKYQVRRTMGLAYRVKELGAGDTATVEPDQYETLNMTLIPYPNPAVLSQMGGNNNVTFRGNIDFSVFYDFNVDEGYRSTDIHLTVDIFTIAGEKVATVLDSATIEMDPFGTTTGEFEVQWDMKNDAGREVVSGVYIAVSQLFDANRPVQLGSSSFRGLRHLATFTGKVAIIR